MDKQRITLKDIANELNISVGTVDRAINGRGRIKEETRQQVLQKIEELGYTPNRLASALAKRSARRIAFVVPAHNPFWEEIIRGARAACAEITDFGIQIEFHTQQSDYDAIEQVHEMEAIIPTKPDGIILVPLHQYLALAPINQAVDSGIPVITVNMDAPASKRLCYVGENAFCAGQLVGSLFGRLMGGAGNVAMILGSAELSQFQMRKDGFLKMVEEKYPNIHIIGQYEFSDNQEMAYEIAKRLILSTPDLRGVFSNTSTGAIAIGRAIRDTGHIHKIVSVGYDVNDLIYSLLEENALLATVTQSPYLQGYNAVMLMHRLLTEKQMSECEFNYVRANIILDRGLEEMV